MRRPWIALLVLLTGCGLVPERTQLTVQYYDLGLPEAREIRDCCRDQIEIGTVRTAPMLASQSMWYRFGSESVKPTSFAVSRWVAAPGALIEQYLRVALGVAESNRFEGTPFHLSLNVERMEQHYVSESQSHALLTVSATLSHAETRQILENRVFRLRQPTATADPESGVRALAALTSDLVDQIQNWMCTTVASQAADD